MSAFPILLIPNPTYSTIIKNCPSSVLKTLLNQGEARDFWAKAKTAQESLSCDL